MGQSTNGELWYGAVFEEGYEFPWDAEPFSGDLEGWWRAQNGFDDSRGYPAEGWLDYQKQFDVAHPCPAKLVNYCSGEYPMYALAVHGTTKTASRGYPVQIEGLGISQGEIEPLKALCEKYELKPEGEYGWYLSSYWE